MLELYCGMTEDEYGLFMTQLMQMAGGAEGSILEPENVSIYRERVWKSTGEDRIEHISGEKAYIVEKWQHSKVRTFTKRHILWSSGKRNLCTVSFPVPFNSE